MAMPSNQVPQNASEMVLNLARALGLEIEIKGSQESQEPQKRKHKGRKLPKVLTSQQVEKLLEPINTKCATGVRNMAALMTMYKAGLRVSEICSVTPADIDLVSGKIFIQNGKGGKDRIVVIGRCLMDYLQKWDEVRPQKAERFFCAVNKATPMLPRYFNTVLERLSNQSGVFLQDGHERKPVSCHCLRHSYATDLLSKGMNIREVQELLGHSSIQTTTIYTHISMDELDKKIKALG